MRVCAKNHATADLDDADDLVAIRSKCGNIASSGEISALSRPIKLTLTVISASALTRARRA